MKRASLLIVFLIVLIDLIGFGIVIPILPYYARSFNASAVQIGWLMTCYSLMQFLVAPLWGRLSDRVGRRPVLLFSLMGTSLSLVLLGSAHSLLWLFMGRTFAGICGANISTAYAYVSDVTTDQNRAKGMGAIGAAFGLGFIFGPVVGGLLSKWGYGVPMYAAAGLAAVNCVAAYFILGEPLSDPALRAEKRQGRPGFSAMRSVMGNPLTGVPIAVFFLFTLAVTQMEVVFAIFLQFTYGFNAEKAGMLLAMIGVIMALIQGGAIGKLARRFGEKKLILAGSVFCAAGLTVFAMTSTLSIAVTGLILLALGHGVMHPSLSSLTSQGAHPKEKGMTMGVFHSASSLSRVIGPPLAGFFYDHLNPRAPFLSATAFVICAAAILARKSKN